MKYLNVFGLYALFMASTTFGTTLPAETLNVETGSVVVFEGMCDASGAVPMSGSRFMVADDEDNILRVYEAETGGMPVASINLTAELQETLKMSEHRGEALTLDDEFDLEAATQINGISYWLTSHARSKGGERKAERFQLIALNHGSALDNLKVTGQPYLDLLDAMVQHRDFRAYKLKEASTRAAESSYAVNIEGMTARIDGGMFIGFRNPVPDGKALIVVLENPEAVVQGEPPKLGTPIELDLGGLGVRGLTSWQGTYILAAGDVDSGSASVLYSWAGAGAGPRKIPVDMPSDFNPEAFFTPESRDRFLVLSDDGTLKPKGGKRCKNRSDASKKSFRGLWLLGATAPQHQQTERER